MMSTLIPSEEIGAQLLSYAILAGRRDRQRTPTASPPRLREPRPIRMLAKIQPGWPNLGPFVGERDQ